MKAPWISGLLAVSGALSPRDEDVSGLTPQTVSNVRARLLESATHSWEIGTATEALMELSWPELSVYKRGSIPPPSTLPLGYAADVLDIAEEIIANKTAGTLPIIDGDGASGDPASLGMAVILRNWTLPDKDNTEYAVAADEQLEFLLNDVPRTAEGAISQRDSEVQLWDDFIYMAPPFLAYYGAVKSNLTILQLAFDQCRLYRDVLKSPNGLFQHILLGSWNDTTHWGTGIGWAAAGMMRVLATLDHSEFAPELLLQRAELASWVDELVGVVWTYQKDNGTLFNIIDDDTSFADSSSTALVASATYRLAARTKDYTHIPAANKAFDVIKNSIGADGWLANTVDPLLWNTWGPSPEGQAFVLLLHAAQRDFVQSL